MYFGEIAVGQAEGAVLAHSVKLPGRAMKKGRLLSEADIAALIDAGIESVVAARFDPGDVAEDEAATRIAEAATGAGVNMQAAFTGRSNLYAETEGIAVIDRDRVTAST